MKLWPENLVSIFRSINDVHERYIIGFKLPFHDSLHRVPDLGQRTLLWFFKGKTDEILWCSFLRLSCTCLFPSPSYHHKLQPSGLGVSSASGRDGDRVVIGWEWRVAPTSGSGPAGARSSARAGVIVVAMMTISDVSRRTSLWVVRI